MNAAAGSDAAKIGQRLQQRRLGALSGGGNGGHRPGRTATDHDDDGLFVRRGGQQRPRVGRLRVVGRRPGFRSRTADCLTANDQVGGRVTFGCRFGNPQSRTSHQVAALLAYVLRRKR